MRAVVSKRMDTVSVVFLSISLVGCCSQRLKAERELDRDLKEAEATESREKKTKLVGGEGDIEPWLLLSQASLLTKVVGGEGDIEPWLLLSQASLLTKLVGGEGDIEPWLLLSQASPVDKTGGWRGRHRAMALAQPGLSC